MMFDYPNGQPRAHRVPDQMSAFALEIVEYGDDISSALRLVIKRTV